MLSLLSLKSSSIFADILLTKLSIPIFFFTEILIGLKILSCKNLFEVLMSILFKTKIDFESNNFKIFYLFFLCNQK